MAYQVLARTYRPMNFTDLVGQDHISETLLNAIKTQRVGHAYLFVGSRGTGKTTSARIFAKALNCETPLPDGNPCGQCLNCREITEGSALDVREIDGASNNKVEHIREIRDNVQFSPARCKYKIYIIDEAHMLTTQAWNALLKTLEEPPEHVKFFFATTEVHKVIPTILSRCQRFDLKRLAINTISQRLHQIADIEKISIDDNALTAIARAANGGMRDALSILDQMIAFCSNAGKTINENDVTSVFGMSSTQELASISTAILNNDAATLIGTINTIADQGKNLELLYGDLLQYSRNLLICKFSGQNAESILEIDQQAFQTTMALAQQCDEGRIQRVVDGLLDNDGKIRHTLNKRVFLEVTLIKVMREASAVSLDAVLAHLQNLKKKSPDTLSLELPTPAKIILPEVTTTGPLTPVAQETQVEVISTASLEAPQKETLPQICEQAPTTEPHASLTAQEEPLTQAEVITTPLLQNVEPVQPQAETMQTNVQIPVPELPTPQLQETPIAQVETTATATPHNEEPVHEAPTPEPQTHSPQESEPKNESFNPIEGTLSQQSNQSIEPAHVELSPAEDLASFDAEEDTLEDEEIDDSPVDHTPFTFNNPYSKPLTNVTQENEAAEEVIELNDEHINSFHSPPRVPTKPEAIQTPQGFGNDPDFMARLQARADEVVLCETSEEYIEIIPDEYTPEEILEPTKIPFPIDAKQHLPISTLFDPSYSLTLHDKDLLKIFVAMKDFDQTKLTTPESLNCFEQEPKDFATAEIKAQTAPKAELSVEQDKEDSSPEATEIVVEKEPEYETAPVESEALFVKTEDPLAQLKTPISEEVPTVQPSTQAIPENESFFEMIEREFKGKIIDIRQPRRLEAETNDA